MDPSSRGEAVASRGRPLVIPPSTTRGAFAMTIVDLLRNADYPRRSLRRPAVTWNYLAMAAKAVADHGTS